MFSRKMGEGISIRPSDCENCWKNVGRDKLNQYKAALLCSKCYGNTIERFGDIPNDNK